MPVEIIDCVQGSPEWFGHRLGIPTASEFAAVLALPKGDGHLSQAIIDSMVASGATAAQLAAAVKAAKKNNSSPSAMRRTYMRKLAGELVTGEPSESYQNDYMDRGHEQEDELRRMYSMMENVDVVRVGFIKNGRKGCSPDGLVGKVGMNEIKSAAPHLLIDAILKDEYPPEHKAQLQGNLWVAEREWIDIIVGFRKMPPVIKRVVRDDAYIKNLEEKVAAFLEELDEIVAKVRAYA